MKQLKSLLRHPFFQGSFIFTALSFLSNILNYVFNFLLARIVSVSQYGEYSSSLSYFLLFSVPFGALSLILVRKIGKIEKEKREEYIFALQKALWSYGVQHWLSVGISSLVLFLILFRFSNLNLSSVIFILIFSAVMFFVTMYTAIFQAKKEFFFAGGFLCALALFKVLGGSVAAFFHSDLAMLYAVIIVSHMFVMWLAKGHIYKPRTQSKLVLHIPRLRQIVFRPSFYVPVITFFGLTALISLDVIIVKKFFSPEDAGLYAALSLFGKIILYVSLPLISVAFSFFTGSDTQDSQKKVLWLSMGLVGLMGVVSIGGYSLFSTLVVKVIVGSQYLSIVPVIWMTAIFGSVYSLATLLGQYLVAKHHPGSMIALGCAALQGLLLFFFHATFVQVLVISIVCSVILSAIYLAIYAFSDK